MQISHTVFRGRNNEIVLQLLSDDAPLAAPEVITEVEVSVSDGDEWIDTGSEHVAYDSEDGTLTMALGRIETFTGLPDGVYQMEVTGFKVDDDNGIAFGGFLIYLRDWGNENGS